MMMKQFLNKRDSSPLLLEGGGSDFWRIGKYTHCLITGSSGQGKTWAGWLILSDLYLKTKNYSEDKKIRLVVADPKFDWRFAKESKWVFRGDEATKAVDVVFSEFEKRKIHADDIDSFPFLILWIDEANSLVESILDKKIKDEFIRKIRLLLFQARFVKIRVLMLGQAISASVTGGSDARSQFDCILVFNINNPLNRTLIAIDEQDKNFVEKNLPRGQAYWVVDGEKTRKVKLKRVPPKGLNILQENLKKLLDWNL